MQAYFTCRQYDTDNEKGGGANNHQAFRKQLKYNGLSKLTFYRLRQSQ